MLVNIPAIIAILSTDAAGAYSWPTNRSMMDSLKHNIKSVIFGDK